MAITAVRIDGRLIHGQVANLWTTKLGVSRIMVVDNEVSKSDVDKAALKLAKPAGVNLSILDEKRAADHIKAGKYDSQKVFIVAKRPEILLQMVDDGVPITVINVGNMSQNDDTQSLANSINVDAEDVKAFNELNDKGVKLTAQMVPSDPVQDFMPLLKKFK
ncbi:PTS family mannose fructose sorbose porter component IIB [Lactobacillus selangorensis]|uniref:PTS family mannose fructose sorbose porter component IIB n=1 Tax=Lactobacillus selangorensis TaxID=81857 RepID=A0A0R2FNN5_9LACO|nr:PTS sugar transporter subunit IIB [Lactobacillus selangorensis]KRN27543.1 PTS family mannose fructose sorbose porter component IIB [Lactobacillus selangorensis]KRN30185.1 PTS family mannose fructose sorbose porter component IIB [Lactobacillus selangorensis]